jgi:cytochrome P450
MAVEIVERPATAAPGPKGLPLIGSVIDFKRDILGTLHSGLLQYGDVVRFKVGPPPVGATVYGLFHPDGVQHILAGAADFYHKNDPVYFEIRELLGNGLLTSQGEQWKRQKRLVQPLFTHKRVAGYVPMMAEEGETVVQRWSAAQRKGDDVDLNREMTRVTLNVVGRALFGCDVEEAVRVLKDAVPYLSRRAISRGLSPFKVPETWPLPSNKKAARYKSGIYGVVDDLINRRHSVPDGDNEDLLSLLIKAQDPENGEGMSDSEVRDQALIFLLAGHETTATSLTYTFYLLGRHPEVQARVRAEVDQVLGDREPTINDYPTLAYTTMVIKEAMRLYPAAYATGRVPDHDDEVMGFPIPAGSPCIASPWVTHRHTKFWDDPSAFIPERFTPDHEKARHRYAYFPFGGGPRACIGQYFSMLESVIVVATVMRAFKIETLPDPGPLFTGITLRPAGPVPAKVTAH